MFSTIRKYFNIIAVSFIVGLTAIFFIQNKKIKKLDKELAQVTNNYQFYQSLASSKDKQNRVLQLSINELNTSNDSLLQDLNKAKKKLKVKDKSLESAHVINTEMKDTTEVKILTKEIDFTQQLKLNSLTTITVSRKDSILTTILDLKNQQVLFIEEKKEYRNQYKNGWSRFWHFDYKKDRIKRYQITNSNDLIKVTDTRVVELSK